MEQLKIYNTNFRQYFSPKLTVFLLFSFQDVFENAWPVAVFCLQGDKRCFLFFFVEFTISNSRKGVATGKWTMLIAYIPNRPSATKFSWPSFCCTYPGKKLSSISREEYVRQSSRCFICCSLHWMQRKISKRF